MLYCIIIAFSLMMSWERSLTKILPNHAAALQLYISYNKIIQKHYIKTRLLIMFSI